MNKPVPATGHSSGFTLIEVMVAMLIVGIALPALMFQLGSQADNSDRIHERTRASWVVQDQLVLLQLRQAAGAVLDAGEWRGESQMGGRTWYWLRIAEPTPAPGLLRHSIRVADSPQALSAADSAVYTLDAYLMTQPPGVMQTAAGGEP